METSADDSGSRLDELFAELCRRIQESPRDVGDFLLAHPAEAVALLTRLAAAARLGFVPPVTGSVSERIEERWGIALARETSPSAPLPRAEELVPRHRVADRFQMLAPIGSGGQSDVWLAIDHDLVRHVALKILRLDTTPAASASNVRRIERFVTEAKITARLAHPGVVPIHEMGILADGRVYLAMTVIRGRPLSRLIRIWNRRPRLFDRTRVLEILRQLCSTIEFAHAQGVLHRDLKPSNVMVGRYGEVQVLDWGLAKLRTGPELPPLGPATSARGAGALTQEGDILGTPEFMAPEQALGARMPWDVRTDVYGLGGVLLAALTGNPVRQGGSPQALLFSAARGERSDPKYAASHRRVAVELRAVCDKALEPSIEKRYASAGELAGDLLAFLEARPIRARKDLPHRRTIKAVRRHPVAALCLIVLLLAGVLRASWKENEVLAERGGALAWAEGVRKYADACEQTARLNQTIEDDTTPARRAWFCARLLEPFTHLGLDLERRTVGEVARELDLLRAVHPELQPDPVDTLFGVGNSMLGARIATAFWWRTDPSSRPARELSPTGARRAEQLAREHPEALERWVRIDALLHAVKLEAWKVRRWDALCEWARHGTPLDPDELDSGEPGDWPEVSIARVDMAIKMGDRPRALELLRRLNADHPGQFWGHFLLGHLLIDEPGRDLAQAESELSIAMDLDPESLVARLQLGRAILVRGDAARAHAHFVLATESSPDAPPTWCGLSWVLRSLGRIPESIAAARRALEIEPANPGALAQLALSLERAWQSDASPATAAMAIEAAESSIAERETNADAWEALVTMLLNTRRFEEAERWARRAVEQFPGHSRLELLLARLLFLSNVAASQPDADPEALRDMLEARCLVGEIRTRESPWTAASIEARKEEIGVLFSSVVASTREVRLRMWPEVARELELVVACDPRDLLMRFLLARAYFGLDRYSDSVRELQRSVDGHVADLRDGRPVLGVDGHRKDVAVMLRWKPLADPSLLRADPRQAPFEPEFQRSLEQVLELQRLIDERSAVSSAH